MNNQTGLIETKQDKIFFKLLVRESENKKLRQEIGVLNSEIDELKYKLDKVSSNYMEYKNKYILGQKEVDSLSVQEIEKKYKKIVKQKDNKNRLLKKTIEEQQKTINSLINKIHTKTK